MEMDTEDLEGDFEEVLSEVETEVGEGEEKRGMQQIECRNENADSDILTDKVSRCASSVVHPFVVKMVHGMHS